MRGLTLIELLIATGVLAVALMLIANMAMQLTSISHKTTEKTEIESFRKQIINTVTDPNAWAQTYTSGTSGQYAGGNMGCILNNTTSCPAGQMQPFALLDGAGNLVYDGLSASEGFTPLGLRCTTFDTNNATSNCFYHYALTWTAVCNGSCINPVVKVSAQLQVAKNANSIVSTTHFSIPALYRTAH